MLPGLTTVAHEAPPFALLRSPRMWLSLGRVIAANRICGFERAMARAIRPAPVPDVRLGRALPGACWRSRAFECRAYRQSGTEKSTGGGRKCSQLFSVEHEGGGG